MVLKAVGVTKEYAGVTVLKGVDFEAERGLVTCLVGPNGSGKTTLLRILALLEKPDSGTVLLDGEEASAQEVRRRAAYLPQRPVVLTASVYRNIYLPLRARGLPHSEAAERARKYLRLLGLESLSNRPAQSLSGGQKQLLGVARALALEPEILLLDEPTSHLDVANAAAVRALVREYARERGAVVVVTTHSSAELREVADKAVLLVSGTVRGVFTAPIAELELLKLL